MVLLGGALSWPFVARAQQQVMPVIGWLSIASPGQFDAYLAAFRQGLAETGYVEGQNVSIEYRWAENRDDRLPGLAAQLVGRAVDVIATNGGEPSAFAAKKATPTIPIVSVVGQNPVATGLVASFARPSGNLTGFTILNEELIAKRLELLCDLLPRAKVIALLVNPSFPQTGPTIRDMQEAARVKAVLLPILKARSESEIDGAFASLAELRADGLVVEGKSPFRRPSRATGNTGRTSGGSGDLFEARIHRGWRSDQLWLQPYRDPSRDWHLRRKNSQRRQAGRSAGPATDKIRAGGQSQDCQGARPYSTAINSRPRRRGDRVKRRGVLALLAAATMPLPFAAGEPAKVFRLGVLSYTPPGPGIRALEQQLQTLGWEEGRNLQIDFVRLDDTDADRSFAMAAELVGRGVDAIYAGGPEPAVKLAVTATRTLPVVMLANDYDPVARGYVASLARPGGNVTGVFFSRSN
jgi:ABC-type uncharacterized transport system substrate-binding protein